MHPHLFHLGHLTLQTYGALAAIGFVCALLLALRNAKICALEEDAVWGASLTAIVGTLLLSRALLVFQNLKAFRTFPLLILTLPTVTRFGLAASILCGLAYARYRHLPTRPLGDAVAPAAALLAAFLHLGDLMSGNDIGTATLSPWGKLIPSLHSANGVGSYPVALYGTLAFAVIALAATLYLPHRDHAGEVLGAVVLLAASTRFLLDLLRPESIEAATLFLGLRLDQWLLLCIVVSAGTLLLRPKERLHAQ